ncbi:uncharacterized protein [Primulina huaijiensis]|uniref:uncharacterized protein isoform X1 n=1 Tax=Primulina huaijiensis TaxID=1492673 RepID=UPI003CC74063
MEQLGGGGAGGRDIIGNRIINHHRSPPSPSDRLLGVFQSQSSSAAPPLELSEHDIFSSPSGSSSPSNVDPSHIPSPTQNASNRNKSHGILAALNDNMGTKSGSGTGSGARPVFNHKASTSASLSSSSSTSPAASFSSRIMIPRRPPPLPQVDRVRLLHQSAPVKVPVIPEAMRRRAMELDEVLSEKDEEEENGVILPPHEVVAARNSPILSFSVLEGAGRTLKGRDLRQEYPKSCDMRRFSEWLLAQYLPNL